MKVETRARKDAAKLAAWLKANGHDELKVESALKEAPDHTDKPMLEVEGVLLYLNKPTKFLSKKCKACKEPFLSNYHAVAYCSNACRAKTLFAETGIPWNPHKTPAERWGGEAPILIPPAAIKKLRNFAESLLAQLDQTVVPESVESYVEVSHQPTVEIHTIPDSSLLESLLLEFEDSAGPSDSL